MFPLSRAFKRGNLHSTGISRFFAKPVSVPLLRSHLSAFYYVVHSYPYNRQELRCMPGLLHCRCSTRCCLRPRGLTSHFPVAFLVHGLRVGTHNRQIPKLSRSRGYIFRFRAHTLHLDERPMLLASVLGGWIYLTQKGFQDNLKVPLSILLYNSGSEPG